MNVKIFLLLLIYMSCFGISIVNLEGFILVIGIICEINLG